MSYHNTIQDPNVIAWMIGGRNPGIERDLEHRRALAESRPDHADGLTTRLRRAIRTLDPRPAPQPVLDCCTA